MTAATRHFADLLRAARNRASGIVLALALPLAMAAVFATWRWFGSTHAALAAAISAASTTALLWHRLRRLDREWLARRLDATRPELEDSSRLLLHDGARTRLQRLQKQRIGERLQTVPAVYVQPAWPWRALALSMLASGGILALALAWQGPVGAPVSDGGNRPTDERPATAGPARIITSQIEVVPPDYTGLPARSGPGLDASAPEGSSLRWELRFEPQPETARLQLLDGETLELQRLGDAWVGGLRLEQSTLYRVETNGAGPADPRMHRLDAVVDDAPRVRVLQPEQNVVYALDGQTEWELVFEASDDHGIGEAELVLTLAQGSGEIVDFTEQRRTLAADEVLESGGPVRQRYATTLDLEALGVGPGDDLVARMEVLDNREPDPQPGRSASVVLRWPPPTMGDVAGFDGLMQRAMPAYFRSQRQIIIDAEALIAKREGLEQGRFSERSNDIGIDQQLLRLRYGQFMGEEAEGGELGHDHDHDHAPAPQAEATADAPEAPEQPRVFNPLFADSAAHEHDHDHDHDGDHDHAHGGDDEHDHGQEDTANAPGSRFGDADDIVARYGHMHDIPEAATLLDPQTRETLRGALRAMWASEGALRMGAPDDALPHAREALELIQEVRQANRIYLARVGLELPPIDESRRLSADLDGLSDRDDPIEAATGSSEPLLALWAAAQAHVPEAERQAAMKDAAGWLLDNRAQLDDPMALLGAIDALQRVPACVECAVALRAALWPQLALPAARVKLRNGMDEAGARYLQRLGAQGDDP